MTGLKGIPLLLVGLSLGGVFLPVSAQADSRQRDRQIWTGRSSGFLIQWTTSDILVHSGDNANDIRFSAKALAYKDLERTRNSDRESLDTESPLISYERDFTLLSVVGSLLSFQDHYFASFAQEAHPAGETRFTAINLANGGEPAKLTEFFSEADILNTLLEDPLIKEAFQSSKNSGVPRTLQELMTRLSSGELRSEKYCYSVSDDFLTRFVFHHIEGTKVAVRIGLSGMGPCRELLTPIGILLPIPDSLKDVLGRARSRKEGFLMKDQKKIAHGQKTTFSFVLGKTARKGLWAW